MIYILCPANSYTGGPTLAHQLCYVLNQNKIQAKMWYFCSFRKRRVFPVHENYRHFNNPFIINRPRDLKENTIVALESVTPILQKFSNARRIIWWMSVDNFYLNMGTIFDVIRKKIFKFSPSIEYCKKYKDKKIYQEFKKSDIIHCVQSEYARLFLLGEGIKKTNIYNLGDYIEDEVVEAHALVDYGKKENNILYNPKKGFEFTQKIIVANPQYNWIPLINMSKDEIVSALLNSKLYIDFGNHPGKDRFPREAVLCGCCIVTGKRGAAANDVDIPISEKYKFVDSEDNISGISDTIRDIIEHFNDRIKDFNLYCNLILGEKEKFRTEALTIFSKTKE